MSSETQILDQIKTDLMFLSTANNYANTLISATEGYMPISADNDLNRAYFFMGNRKPDRYTNDNKPVQWEGEF